MKHKLTKQEAVEKFRTQWAWVGEEPGRRKEDWPDLEDDVAENCYLCEYVNQQGLKCGECPIQWPPYDVCSLCAGHNGLWAQWERALWEGKFALAQGLAQEISKLSTKEEVVEGLKTKRHVVNKTASN